MTRKQIIKRMRKIFNDWESLDKEDYICDLLHWLSDSQMLVALNLGGPYMEDLKTEFLKHKGE